MIRIGEYRHFRGGRYKVMGIAEHSETREELVIYRSLKNNKVWARPKKMFLEQVKYNDKIVPRFEYLKK